MKAKQVLLGTEARKKLISGVNQVGDAVGSTLGPGGRLVVLRRAFGPARATKDGVTVAEEICLKDHMEDAGAKLCIQVARKCNQEAGDGTTTATILAQALVNQATKFVESGGNPVKLRQGMDKAGAAVLAHIERVRKTISLKDEDQVRFIATVSGNDKEIGQLTAEAFIKAGELGIVQYEMTKGVDTTVEIVDGTQFDRGFVSPYFVTDPDRMRAVLDHEDGVYILLWERSITKVEEIIPLLKLLAPTNRPMLIIADSVEADALQTIVTNLKHIMVPNRGPGSLDIVCVKAPGWGERRKELLEDLAIVTGGTFFSDSLGVKLENVKLEGLGVAKKVVVTAGNTTIFGGGGEQTNIDARVRSLQSLLEEVQSEDDKLKVKERIAKLAGGISVIKIGAQNETEMAEKQDRFQDAVCATKAALEEGIVPGGGTTLIGASRALDQLRAREKDTDVRVGIDIVRRALEEPCRKISENAGFEGATVMGDIRRSIRRLPSRGFNASTGKMVDMYKSGIVDPAKVTRLALQNALTIAGMILLSGGIIVDEPSEDKGGGGGNPYEGMM